MEAVRMGAVVAAAGMSSRMGRFKPLLDIQGEPAIVRVIHTLRSGGAENIFVVTGHHAEELRAALEGHGVSFVHNPDYAATGMFESVRLGLERAQRTCGRILVTPSDVPLFRAETVRTVLTSGEPIVIPTHGGRDGHPVLFEAEVVPEVLSFHGEGGLHGAILALGARVRRVEVPDDRIFTDMDTPEDYRRLILEGSA